MEENKSFPEAIQALLDGKTEEVVNEGWNGKDMAVKLQKPDENSFMTEPYLYLEIGRADTTVARMPWLASQLDMLSKKWRYNLNE